MEACPHCGAQVMIGNEFCTRCRKPLNAAPAAAPADVYAPPRANLDAPADTAAFDHAQLERLRTGQRLVILAIIISFLVYPLGAVLSPEVAGVASLVLSLANVVLIVVGMWRLSLGHGYGTLVAVIFCVMGIVPLLGLVLMIGLSISATGKLRKAGYKVGLLGAKPKP